MLTSRRRDGGASEEATCSSSPGPPPPTPPLPLMLSLSGPPGGLGRGRGLDPLPEGGGLAPLQEHLPGLVRHRACGRPVQRRHHGPAGLRHPALRVRGRGCSGGGGGRWGGSGGARVLRLVCR